jgi:hypothetical protein
MHNKEGRKSIEGKRESTEKTEKITEKEHGKGRQMVEEEKGREKGYK